MNILHVFKTYLPDNNTGIPQVIFNLAESQAGFGVHSTVLTLSANPAPEPIVIGQHEVHQARQDLNIASTGLSLEVFGRFGALADSADLIHYHFPWPLADVLHLALARKKPSVVTYHSDIVKQGAFLPLYAPLMHRFLNSADAIVATSPIYAQTSPVLKRHANKTHIIPIGIGDGQLASQELIGDWERKLGSDFFLFIGAPRYYKGLQFLLEAARIAGLPIVIAGKGHASVTGADNLHFVGEVTEADKAALLSLCRAVVLPSHLRSEAFGIVLLEAARAGNPAICCEIGSGTSFVVQNGQTGLVTPPEQPQALADAMLRLSNDVELAKRLGDAARVRFEELFTARKMAEDYLGLYEAVLNQQRD